MKPIDLGYEEDFDGCHISCEDKEEGKVRYPCLYIYDAPKDLMNLEGEGEAVIRFKVRSRTISEKDDGKDKNSIDIEIRSIEPKQGTSKESNGAPSSLSLEDVILAVKEGK